MSIQLFYIPIEEVDGILSSEARKGEMVTTHVKYGGIGLGYLVDGVVYKTTGSAYAIRADADVCPMVSFDRDGGAGYRAEVKRVVGWYATSGIGRCSVYHSKWRSGV